MYFLIILFIFINLQIEANTKSLIIFILVNIFFYLVKSTTIFSKKVRGQKCKYHKFFILGHSLLLWPPICGNIPAIFQSVASLRVLTLTRRPNACFNYRNGYLCTLCWGTQAKLESKSVAYYKSVLNSLSLT